VKAERESTRLMDVRLVEVLVASPLLMLVGLKGGMRAILVLLTGRAGTGDSCLGAVGWGGVRPSRSRILDLGLVRPLPC